jgi:predicted porin
MKKLTRLNAALGMALAVTGVAHAAEDSYKFSGTLDMGYYRDYDDKNKTGSISRSNVAFDGLKNLGNGMAGTVKLNTRFFLRDPKTGDHLVNEDTKYMFAGEATVGLKGDFGHVRAGRALTALWQNDWAYDAWYNYDQIASPAWWMWHGNSAADANASSKNASFARLNNGVFYASPKFAGGFSVDASVGLKKQTGDKNNSTSVALKYGQGDVNAMLASEKTPTGNTVMFLGANYKMGAITVMGGYDNEKLASGGKNRSVTASARLTDGQMSYMVGFGRQLDYNDANFFSLGANYAYKPNTNLYVSYGKQAKGFWGSTAAKDSIGVGVNYSF